MFRRFLMFVIGFFGVSALTAQTPDVRREIGFPDLPGMTTVVCDVHLHSVFSDGAVWPSVRPVEAWRTGLHAIALTDHIEYRPHKEEVQAPFDRPLKIAEGAARDRNILFIPGAEITRDTPPGHFNALFLKDVKALDVPEFLDQIKAASEQGAFVIWNHQGWKGEDAGRWLEVHTEMLNKKWFQAMEICNGDEYYPTAYQWCLDKNLTIMGNSDMHDPELRRENTAADHRTVTLVFAKERTLPALREALDQGRTAVWQKENVLGKEEWVKALFAACVQAKPPRKSAKSIAFELQNCGPVEVRLKRTGALGPLEIIVPPKSTALVKVPISDPKKPVALEYTANNWLIAPGKNLPATFEF